MKTETTIKIREIGNGFLVNITHGNQPDAENPFGGMGESETMYAYAYSEALDLGKEEALKLKDALAEHIAAREANP